MTSRNTEPQIKDQIPTLNMRFQPQQKDVMNIPMFDEDDEDLRQ